MRSRAILRRSLLAATVSLACASAASAKTITVTTTKDAGPKPGDCASGHPCTLRQAVAKAVAGDIVVVPSDRKHHYVLTLGAVRVTKSLTIRGGGSKTTVIDGNGGNGVFFKTGGTSATPASLTIDGVTVTGAESTGVSFGSASFTDSGAVINEGVGPVILRNCAITANATTAPANHSSVAAGALDSEGGAVTISHCSITNNRLSTRSDNAVGGGGVVSEGGPLQITASNISNNKATMHGTQPIIAGGVISEGGALTVTRSTVANNTAAATNHSKPSDGAGGILSDGGPTMITNGTVSGNAITKSTGNFNSGGVISDGSSGQLVYVTLTHNAGGGGANLLSASPLTSFGSVIALAPSGHPDCLMLVAATSNGYNFSDQKSCGLNGPTDHTHGNPRLGGLANNGGPGPTEAPRSGSPLIDAIPKAQCPASIKTDERGRPRPDDGESRCDIGAYEVQDK